MNLVKFKKGKAPFLSSLPGMINLGPVVVKEMCCAIHQIEFIRWLALSNL